MHPPDKCSLLSFLAPPFTALQGLRTGLYLIFSFCLPHISNPLHVLVEYLQSFLWYLLGEKYNSPKYMFIACQSQNEVFVQQQKNQHFSSQSSFLFRLLVIVFQSSLTICRNLELRGFLTQLCRNGATANSRIATKCDLCQVIMEGE